MRKLLFAIAIAGLLVSGYLLVTYVTGGPIVCNNSHGCEIVRASQYANLWGLPTPFYGVLFYLLLAVGALLLTSSHDRLARYLLTLHTSIGVLVSAWLTYVEAFVIEAWCQWCVVSAVLAVIAFIIVWSTLSKTYDHHHRN